MKIKMVFFVTAAFFFAVLFAAQTSFAKELCLTYDVKGKQISENKDGKKEEKNSSVQLTVGLGSNYFYVSSQNRKTVFDFNKKRIFYIDDAKKIYSDVSLFSNIGFRYMEFQNRLYLRDVLNAAIEKAETKSNKTEEMFDIESLFAIIKPGSPEQTIEEKIHKNSCEYFFNNQAVVKCSLSDGSFSDTEARIFDKYLIYQSCLHPQIRKKIISKKQIPQSLSYTYKETGRTSFVDMSLASSAYKNIDSYIIPSGYIKVYSVGNEKLNTFINDIMLEKSPINKLEKEDFYKIADDLKAKGNYFDAVLVLLECGLQTGDSPTEKMREIISLKGNKDDRIQIFLGIGSPKDEESAKAALSAYRSINRKKLTHDYIIDIMIADNEMALGNFDKAQELFIKALSKNPYITGVYKDLGDMFNISYETISAWQCWDTARFLYPEHKMLQKVNEYEKWLADNFPDFFLSAASQNSNF